MKNINVGSIVIYEGRKCEVTEKTENEVTLKNLEVHGSSDWTSVKISITDIEEDKCNEQ